jgi:hypothetical protein
MSERPRWHRRGLLALATAAVALVLTMSGPVSGGDMVAVPSAPSAVAGGAPEAARLRIMPLGTSSTVGTGSLATAGFRGPLEGLLADDHIAYDMVGSQHSGPRWLADPDHEGHAGWTMRRMQPLVAGWVARRHPDVILLQVGTNDLITGAGAAATAQRLDIMLTTMSAVAPHAHVVVAGVWAPLPAHASARARLSRLFAEVVNRHRVAGQSTTFVDTSTLLTSADLFDGLHANASGYRKIAGMWERAIRAYLTREPIRRSTLSARDAVVGSWPSSPAGAGVIPTSAVANASVQTAVTPPHRTYHRSGPARPARASTRAAARSRCHTAAHGVAVRRRHAVQ